MKKNFLIMLMLVLVQIVSAADDAPVSIGGIFYKLDTGKKQAEVTYDRGYSGPERERKTYKGTVTIPATVSYQGITYDVTSIENSAFSCNDELETVNLPNSILHIGWYAFNCCPKLQTLTIPKSVTDIEYGILSECDAVTSIIVDKDNNVYDSRNNCNAIIHTTTNELIQGCQNTVIPNTVTRIGNKAFENISTLTSIEIPNSVTNIGDDAFTYTGLKELVLPSSIIYLGMGSFDWCSELVSVTLSESMTNVSAMAFENCNVSTIIIPASVVSINNGAFAGFHNPISIYFQSTTPPHIDFSIGLTFGDIATIHVPVGYKDAYMNSDTWKNYTIIDDVVVPESATGISTLNSIKTQNEIIFTLSGERLPAQRKGINIINGKKIYIK